MESTYRKKLSENNTHLISQYVGFPKGRISQKNSPYVKLDVYINWLNDLRTRLNDPSDVIPLFSRYAKKVEAPREDLLIPVSILIDTLEIGEIYVSKSSEEFIDFSYRVVDLEDGHFVLEANNEVKYSFQIEYDPRRANYKLANITTDACPEDLETDFRLEDPNSGHHKSILKYMNVNQTFTIVHENSHLIYTHGQFYDPRFKVGVEFDPDSYSLRNHLLPNEVAKEYETEKGEINSTTTEWPPKAQYRILADVWKDTAFEEIFKDPDIIICDDIGKESADFIYCYLHNPRPRVVFFHCKAQQYTEYKNQEGPVGVSYFASVIDQAVKNLVYLSPANDQIPAGLESWDDKWNKTEIPRILKKPDPADNAKILWDKISKVIKNHNSDKEVWLFVSNIFSKKAFEDKMQGKTSSRSTPSNPPASTLQLAFLLQSTLASVGTTAKFYIICNK